MLGKFTGNETFKIASRHQQNYNDKYLFRVYNVEILLMMDSELV